MSKFYCFNQNNSGGSFIIEESSGISETVIIEAKDARHANSRARQIGLYFNGCASGIDCSCCGDRWGEKFSDDQGTDVPTLYNTPIEDCEESLFRDSVFIHPIDKPFYKVVLKKRSE